jgi:hypothetical protein
MISFSEEILSTIKLSCLNEIEKTDDRISKLVYSFDGLSKTFGRYKEHDELYEFLYEISKEFDLTEEGAYYLYMISKYEPDGEISKNFRENFAIHIILYDENDYLKD